VEAHPSGLEYRQGNNTYECNSQMHSTEITIIKLLQIPLPRRSCHNAIAMKNTAQRNKHWTLQFEVRSSV